MKKIFSFITVSVLIVSFLLITSCCCKKKAIDAVETIKIETPVKAEEPVTSSYINYEKAGHIKATIVYYELDGCSFLIQLDNGDKLEPINLSAEYKKDKLPVWVKISYKKNNSSVCMVGPIVEISEIHLRK